ncbi:MAG: ribosome-associated translation inhibitor RaiA [Synergistaceae bacterium]|nr:ribosome-associated translation inhibitor RaiA [Synergistaceae bacterium]
MEVRFVQRGTEIDGKLRDYMESKMSKMEKFFRKILSCQVAVSHHKGNFNVETTANANGVILRAEENATEPRRAFDQALKNLERRIKRYNSYLKDKGQFQDEEHFSFSLEETPDAAASDAPVIEKVKKIPVHPMDPVEAVMQMELVGHTFFMFQNGETGDINVVYKRKEGDYGLLVPIH